MPSDAAEFSFDRFRLDPTRRMLLIDGKPVKLSARAIEVLIALVQRRDRAVSKNELFDIVWPGLVVEENNLQVHVSALRKVLGPETIATIPGRGYQFTPSLDAADSTVDKAPLGRATNFSTNLPADTAPLIGRDADLSDVHRHLFAHPMVTIVGPGGIGKTRLALTAARAMLGQFDDGAWLIDFTAVADPAQVGYAAAHALSIDIPTGQSSHETVAAALRDQSMLVVLDNCEHVIDNAAALADAVRKRAPLVRILATSQEPLRTADEHVIRLAPLGQPESTETEFDVDQALHYGAVQLFVARARAVDHRFALTPANVAAVITICRQLDGIPLAIELAAARLPTLGVDGLRNRLGERLQLLKAGSRTAPPRQQTLRAALEWSYSLLTPVQQAVFRRLSVFAGGFSLDLAQRVATDDSLDRWALVDELAQLVDKSLVIVQGEDEPRYRLLESARAFGLEQSAKTGEVESMRRRHALAMRDLLVEFDQAVVREPHFDKLLRRLEPELDNLYAAAHWAVNAPGEQETAVALVAYSDWLWLEADVYGEGWRLCHTVRARLDSIPPPLVARFRLTSQGLARARMTPSASWIADAQAAVAEFRAAGDRIGLYRALCVVRGAGREVIGEKEAGALLREAEELEDQTWSPRLRMSRQLALEWWHDVGGRLQQAREAGRKHVSLAREAGSAYEVGALSNLADTEVALGNIDAAIELCHQAIAHARELGRPSAAVHAYANMIPALLERNQLSAAHDAISTGRSLLVRGLGGAFVMLVPLALLVLRRGDHALAAQIIGCADRAYDKGGHLMHPPERRMREAVLGGLQATMPAAQIIELQRQGADWIEDEAFTRGLAVTAAMPSA